jgi:ribosomal protein S18 acetylase RimI-like enzyme
MVSVRRARLEDLLAMQACNLRCLPENYNYKYYMYHYLAWPGLSYLAEDMEGNVVGYVLAKIDEEEGHEGNGHITSLSSLRTHRRLGIASAVMEQTHKAMRQIHAGTSVTLHVRVSNLAALGLYRDRLKYAVKEVAKGYYADGEDAY